MPRPSRSSSRLPLAEALRRLAALIGRVRERIDAGRAFSCEGCDAPCCRVGRNGMLATSLEAEAIADRLERDPALGSRRAEIERRVAETARRVSEEEGGPRVAPPTYDCPFLSEEGGCLVHGAGQPLGCVTYTTMGDGTCDPDVETFEEAFVELLGLERAWSGRANPDGEPLPVAVLRVLRRRKQGRMGRARGAARGGRG